MITSTIFLLGLAAVLFFWRKKIAWGSMFLGIFCMCLLLGTPLGGPIRHASTSVASAVTGVLNSLLAAIGVG